MDASTLQPARAGDEDAFRALTRPYTSELRPHCGITRFLDAGLTARFAGE